MKGLAPEHHLETVEFRGIVRAGDLDPAIGPKRVDGEIERRRGQRADVHRHSAGLDDAAAHARGQHLARGTIVATDGDRRRVPQRVPSRRS